MYFCKTKNKRDVAQPGLEYWSGGPVVASSNLVIPTAYNERLTLFGVSLFCFSRSLLAVNTSQFFAVLNLNTEKFHDL